METKPTLASLLTKSALMLIFISVIFLFGKHSTLLLITNLAATIVALYFWHKRIEVLRTILTMTLMGVIETIATSQGIYSYRSAELVSIPLWLPVGWAFYSLFSFKIIEELNSLLDFEYEKTFFIDNKYLLLFLEFISLPIMLVISFAMWRNTGFCIFGAMFSIIMTCFYYNQKAEIILFPVCIIFAILVEYAGIFGGVWQWNAPDLGGLPLWVPAAYSLFLFLFNRMAIGIDSILEEKAAGHADKAKTGMIPAQVP